MTYGHRVSHLGDRRKPVFMVITVFTDTAPSHWLEVQFYKTRAPLHYEITARNLVREALTCFRLN